MPSPATHNRHTSPASNPRTSLNALASSGSLSNGDESTLNETDEGGPRVVPSLAAGWSHHWRWDGPMQLALNAPRWSHAAGGRQAVVRGRWADADEDVTIPVRATEVLRRSTYGT